MYSNAMNCLNETSIINKSLPPVTAATTTTTTTATTNAKSLLFRAPNGTIGNGSISNSSIHSGVNMNHHENIDANNGQKLMQLVEKIWNQISIHQRKSSSTMVNGNSNSNGNGSTSSNNNNNKNVLATKDNHNNHNHHAHHHNEWSKRNNNDRSGGGGGGCGPAGGGMVNDCRRIMNHNKMNIVKTKYRNNQQHHIQKKLPPPPISLSGPHSNSNQTTTIRMSSTSRTSSSCSSSATVVATTKTTMDDVQCIKCEYHFVDGQIVSKSKCTHKKVPSQSLDIVENVDSKPTTKQQPQQSYGGGINSSKIVSGMAATNYQHHHYQLNNNKNNPNETKPGTGTTTTTPTLAIPTAATASTTLVDINRQCIIQANISHQSIKKYIEAEIIFDNKNMIGVIPVAKVLDVVKIAEEEEQQQPEPEKEQVEVEDEEVVEEKEGMAAENTAALDDNDVVAVGHREMNGNGEQTTLKTTTTVANNKEGMVMELNDDKKKNDGTIATTGSSSSSSSNAPIPMTNGCLVERCLKKIKCLITSFATIQKESDLTNRFINPADIGFKNFDGNNIGLYKNIGYINRNEMKFIQPSKDLLKLIFLIHDPRLLFGGGSTNSGQRATGNAAGSADRQQQPPLPTPQAAAQQDHELDLSDYYNDLDPTQRFYSKKFFYNILDTICRQDETIKNQIRAKCFHYPDGEYSSDGEDGTMSYETCGAGGGSGGTSGKYQTLNEHLDCCWKHKIDDAPFDGQVNIRIATSCNKDELNDKLFDALLRNNQRANKSNNTNSAGTSSNSRTSNNIGHGGNTGNSETFKRNVQSTLQQGLLKLDSYFITEVSFNSSNAE